MPQSSKHRRASNANADSEVATSNSTVNAFFGGRQPSWMSNATPVKPTPRPKPMRQYLQQVPAQASTNVLPSPAPSDEPSPVVSNPQDSPNPQSAALPERQAVETASMDARANPIAESTGMTGRGPVTEARFAPEVTLNNTGEQYARNFPVNGNSSRASFPPGNVTPTAAAAAAFPSQSSAGRLVHPMQSLQNPQVALPSSYTTSPPILQSNAQSPSFMTTNTQGWTTLPPDPVAAERTSKRRRVTPTTSNSQLDQRVALDSFSGNRQLSDVEVARVQILRDACAKGDSFYLAFHQLFCLWSLNPHDVFPYLNLPAEIVDTGFRIMETVLKGNAHVSPTNLRFFIDFPWPLSVMLNSPGSYREAVARVSFFLQGLPSNWHTFLSLSHARGYPYLVDELLVQLRCPSVVLQTIVFTASRRRLGVPDGQLGMEIDQLFKRDQMGRSTQNGEFKPVGYPMYGPNWQKVNYVLIKEYQRLFGTARQQQQASRRSSEAQPAPPRDTTLSSTELAQRQAQQLWQQNQQQMANQQRPRDAEWLAAHNRAERLARQHHAMQRLQSEQSRSQAPNNSNRNMPPQLPGSPGFVSSPTVTSGTSQGQVVQQTGVPQLDHSNNFPGRLVLPSSHTPSPLTSPAAIPPGNPGLARNQSIYQLQNLQNTQFNSQYQVQVRQPSQGSPTIPMNVTMSGSSTAPWPMMVPHGGTIQAIQTTTIPGAVLRQPLPTAQPPSSIPPHGITQRNIHTTPTTGFQGRLIPPKGYEIPRNEHASGPNERKALMMSLHQADVNSPARIQRNGSNNPERYYQAVRSLAMPPVLLDPNLYLQDIEFFVSSKDYESHCQPRKVPGSMVPVSEYFDGSLRYRLRCCKQSTGQAQLSESDWVTSEVSWPKNVWMKLNGQPLAVRRKPHNGKDLPIELTLLIRPGKNVLRVAATLPKPHKGIWYYMAVDVVECFSHSRIVQSVGLLQAEDTIAKIKSRLHSAPSDDEIEISNADLKITLADPWSFSIFKTPVRGANCTHLECFDLENWLETRPPSKPSVKCGHGDGVPCKCLKTKEPSHADKWKCPICDKDARPKSLRIDSFLMGVRQRLELEGKLGVRAILVAPDCEWRPEANDSDDEDDASDDEKDGALATGAAPRESTSAPPSKAPPVQVIELLDDD